MTTVHRLFCKEFLCFSTMPCRRMPLRPVRLLRVDFRGFDSSRLLIIRGGNSHVRIIS